MGLSTPLWGDESYSQIAEEIAEETNDGERKYPTQRGEWEDGEDDESGRRNSIEATGNVERYCEWA